MKRSFLGISLVLFLIVECALSQSCTSRYGNALDGECKLVEECTGAALAGNCADQDRICCVVDSPPPDLSEHGKLKKDIFLKLVGNTTRNRAMYTFFLDSMRLAQINGRYEEFKISAYFAQLVGETNYFQNFESRIIDTDNQNLTWAERYQPRGGILIRGRDNYVLANQSTRYSKNRSSMTAIGSNYCHL
jgi:hypothetical protein